MERNSEHEIVLAYAHERKLRVEFSRQYDRKVHTDGALESSIETTWRWRQAKNGSLFNGTKLRFSGMLLEDDACILQLGLTDYKTYLGTHFDDSLTKFGEECMAQPLGNVVIPVTADGCTVLLLRSENAGEGVGAAVFPGGHPEPDMIDDLQEGDKRVEKELWEGARRELLEEIWVGDEDVVKAEEMILLGMVRRRRDGKVSLVFSAKVGMTGQEVVKRYCEKNDGEESSKMVVIRLKEMKRIADGESVDGANVLAETVGAAELWVMMEKKSG